MSAIRYVFREDGPLLIKAAKRADPQKIGEALATITGANHGRLTPKAVVEAARSNRHVLHKHFEWDDAKAAEAHRLDQARAIIRAIRVEEDASDAETAPRAFHSINGGRGGGTAYRTLDDVRSSLEFQTALLNAAERDLVAFQTRYRALQDVCGDVERAREAIRRRRANLETRAGAA